MLQSITLNVNGRDQAVGVEPDSMLLYALRDNLALRGVKFGCGLAECGVCTVLMLGARVVPVRGYQRNGSGIHHSRGAAVVKKEDGG